MTTVLVTGASRGIGRATVVRLAAAGWDVIAAARSEADVADLVGDRVSGVTLDITDAAQVASLEERLPATLDAVVNNAGIVVGGPVEALPLEELRRQLEVNVVGQVAVTQAVLPRLRASHGRIVFVSSLSGRISTPLTGAYSGSKFALEAIADSLRMELAPWGVRVSLVEPAQTDTDLWQGAEAELDRTVAALTREGRELYAKHIAGYRKSIPMSQRLAKPADTVAQAIERALTDSRPRARYVVGGAPRVQAVLAALTPTRLLDVALSRATGVPRRV
jgi:NAD(P)-dependent dehydrogenase (short-subunit alcohol dehydrogenase family)